MSLIAPLNRRSIIAHITSINSSHLNTTWYKRAIFAKIKIYCVKLNKLRSRAKFDKEKPFDKIKHLLGTAESKIDDLGQRHRDYLIQKIKKNI
jgi:hypothetical protein